MIRTCLEQNPASELGSYAAWHSHAAQQTPRSISPPAYCGWIRASQTTHTCRRLRRCMLTLSPQSRAGLAPRDRGTSMYPSSCQGTLVFKPSMQRWSRTELYRPTLCLCMQVLPELWLAQYQPENWEEKREKALLLEGTAVRAAEQRVETTNKDRGWSAAGSAVIYPRSFIIEMLLFIELRVRVLISILVDIDLLDL